MRRIILAILLIISLAIPLYAMANESVLSKAYSLYYRGRVEEAIQMVEDYVVEHPDAGAYYFLGYAYYELEDLEKAR